ncbi:zinc finger, CCHC-type containing protein [Tanacetum coccineum]|uniref:Zinc finger, CCHC-type containing protein n=1 Tax=Tanacetum coccineum TaxID=301880 RepID=A0ABQ4WGW1_9ASTR
MDTLYFQSVGIIHETTAPYTPQQNGISERKNRVLKEMVNSMLSYSGMSQGFWGEAMAVVRLPDPKLKTLGERGIECIFVGYAEHSKAFRFYVIEPNDSVAINSIIESRDAIFDEHRFSSVPRPSQRSLVKGTDDSCVEGIRDEVSDQHSYCFNVEDDPKTFDEAMKSQDVAFWKEAINDEMNSIMGINTWVLTDLPPGCKWIFKRKLKVDGTVEKFKASLIIHQMDVKTTFLNRELEEEVYMNQPLGFIFPDNENKVLGISISISIFKISCNETVSNKEKIDLKKSHHRFFPVDTSLILVESHKSPTKSLFDVGSSRISIFIVKNHRFTRMFWQYHKDNA